MKITVGSLNQTKIDAVRRVVEKSSLFENPEVVGLKLDLEEFGHPKNLKETIDGAIDRAKAAFQDCAYSFEIEGGLMAAPETKTGYFEIAACAIYDGKNIHLGLSPAFEWPKEVFKKIFHEGLDGSQAFKATGLTTEEKVGASKGGIHLLSKGRVDRTEFNRMAVEMAMIHLEHPEHF